MARGDKTLQRLIDRTVRAQNAFYLAQEKLNNYCQRRWGFEPADRDLDDIIDGVLGGNGLASGITAEDFCDQMDGAKEPNYG